MATHWAAAVFHCCCKLLVNKSSGLQLLVKTEHWGSSFQWKKKEFCFDKKRLWKVATHDQRTHTETLGTGPVKVNYLSALSKITFSELVGTSKYIQQVCSQWCGFERKGRKDKIGSPFLRHIWGNKAHLFFNELCVGGWWFPAVCTSSDLILPIKLEILFLNSMCKAWERCKGVRELFGFMAKPPPGSGRGVWCHPMKTKWNLLFFHLSRLHCLVQAGKDPCLPQHPYPTGNWKMEMNFSRNRSFVLDTWQIWAWFSPFCPLIIPSYCICILATN